MPRRAYFVIGSEGSGTNMLARALVSAGCYEEDWHAGWHDDYKFDEMPSPFVFRRSLPHAGKWPDPIGLTERMEQAGYDVQYVLILRDWHCTIQSVIRRDPERVVEYIENNMRRAIYMTSEILDDLLYVSYESFCLHPEFRRWLFCERLGLPEPTIEIDYANPKYYEGGEDYLR